MLSLKTYTMQCFIQLRTPQQKLNDVHLTQDDCVAKCRH